MNTSKQVNVMIGLLFLAFITFGLYILTEPDRQATAEEEQTELFASRGAELFVTNCRNCHGLQGLGPEEGAIAPALNNEAFLILDENNEFGVEPTAQGEANSIHDFLFNTIACGRVNTVMPTWSEDYGGPMPDIQIEYIVTMITEGRWDLVEEIGREHDEELGLSEEEIQDIVVAPEDAGALALTEENCGQYVGATAQEFRDRDPFATPTAAPDPDETAEPGETPDEPEGPLVQGQPAGEFFANNCASCHGPNREGGIGPPLTPDALTESDDFYFETIAEGREGTPMPSWRDAGLTDDEIQAMVQFITTTEP